MMYFGDVRGRPAYCAAHVVPLESLPADLASAATTPDFAWITPDDCSDMGRLRTPRTASTRPSARRRSSWARPASGRATSPRSGTPIRVPAPAVQGSVVSSAAARGGSAPTAWVANYGSATVTPIDTATRRPGRAIKVGAAPVALAITPNGRMIYVVSEGSSTATPIATATNRPGAPITVGAAPAPSR
jgi:YVTN family beta-propeller protein